ncbi:C-type lectin domain family 4 member M-like isoform X13 [Dicentrarchus labrax]|uniref:C-type lectin domain family 4 member M-like isoform X11 n=1 Tax=Dicentrarchus labrax TaxID=13489 RepID=UPI0021F50310|nr:C-type lectin domain family 4 member M-like isoform X11 [Dicentrarchus labrax]XP_051240062.1 C-type lectin domain family 4 member M-like isoform X13 [Dicentrarchus labrax]
MEIVFHKEKDEISMVNEDPYVGSAMDATLLNHSDEDIKATSAVPGNRDVKKTSYKAAAVGLALLCLLLLIGLKTLVSRFTKCNCEREMEMVQLQTSYNNLTNEKDQLQTSYNNLTKERDQLQTSYNNLTKERNQLQTSYNNLTKGRDQLQTSYNNLTKGRDQLQTSYNNLTKERDQLQTSYNNLTKERDQLQTSYNNLTKERDQLQTSYNNLTKEKDQLQTNYNNLTKEREQLAKEKDQLQERFEALAKDRTDLQRKLQETEAVCKTLTEERADLKRILNDFSWVYFRGSFYQVSSLKKSWQQSRDDCLQKGADLLIINSREEQIFTNKFKKYMWIGLTDSETEGRWKWVDGTPLTISYWASGEPNGKKGENCGDIKSHDAENSWNDEGCSSSLFWICEKKVRL